MENKQTIANTNIPLGKNIWLLSWPGTKQPAPIPSPTHMEGPQSLSTAQKAITDFSQINYTQKIFLSPSSECIYTAADSTLDGIFWQSGWNNLSMEQFYMQLFECRRLIKPGGWLAIWGVGGTGGAHPQKIRDHICALRCHLAGLKRRPILDFVSPEDWDTTSINTQSQFGWQIELWLAQRLPTSAI